MLRDNSPKYLPLNIIDRQFLVPETDDFANGSYLPMTETVAIYPRTMPSVATLQDALVTVDTNLPQYRLAYTLDPITPRWIRVPDHSRVEYLRNRVHKADIESVHEHLKKYVQHNLSPLVEPFKIFIFPDSLCFHFYHPLGDARFCFQVIASILTALFEPRQFEQIEHNRFVIPLREVSMSSIPQTVKVLGHVVKRVSTKIRNYFSGFSIPPAPNDRDQKSLYNVTVSGTGMDVACVNIPPEKMLKIRSDVNNLSKSPKISLNTYWQILFAFRIHEMGLVDWPIELTTLVDLRRYMKRSNKFYPGNCINNVRLRIKKAAFRDACIDYQSQLDKQIESAYPLSDMFGNWLIALGGDAAFKRANRHWYLKASPHEKRFYTLTNIGRLDDVFKPIQEYLLPDVRFVTPIMGAAPLVLAFTSFNNYGNFTATYKPDILSKEDVLKIMDF